MISEAVISDDGLYRYVLDRRWDRSLPIMAWIMLNPSTADAKTDDPTIRRCMGFARREGCGGICVLNLYALRSSSPRALLRHPDPVGPDNDQWLKVLAAGGCDGPVIAGWGASRIAETRETEVLDLLAGVPVVCLGATRSGAPRHPLYVRSDTPLTVLGGTP